MRIFTFLSLYSSLLFFSITPIYAQQRDTLSLSGLKDHVEVWRDAWGMNHIYAQNQHDLFFTQGYCAARDRLFQFEIWRLQATGTLTTVLGKQALQRDIGARLFKYRGDMKKEMNHYHKDGSSIIQSFVDGVNAYIREIKRSPTLLPFEFKLMGMEPGFWTPEVVISRHQGIIGNVVEELNIGKAVTLVGPAKVKELMWFHPQEPDITPDSSVADHLGNPAILAVLQAYRQELNATELIKGAKSSPALNAAVAIQEWPWTNVALDRNMEGSNNWVVSGNRTASGYPMLADDPHRRIAQPSLRYMVHLQAPGWNVIGAGEPAIPGVSIGHNEHGAWGITIFETDAEDLYVYQLRKGYADQYWYKGSWHKMKKSVERIAVKDAPDTLVQLFYTVHGPVTYVDTVAGKAYAVRSAALEPGGAPYLSALRIDQAHDWNSFREACSFSHVPALNMVWADRKGDIGWQVVGIIPQRKKHSGLVPVPGDGRFEWGPYLPIRERPHVHNPAKGFWATANQNLAPADYRHWDAMGYTWPDAFRGERINQVLGNDAAVTVEKFKALQTDYLSLPASNLVPLLIHLPADTGLYQQALQWMKDWDYRLLAQSNAAAVYVTWERTIMEQAAQRWIPPAIKGLLRFQFTKVYTWLLHPDERFGPDAIAGRNQFLQYCFRLAIDKLKLQLGNDPQHWQYGQAAFKHSQILHPLQELVDDPTRQLINTTRIPRGGYGHTVGSTGDANNQATGATYRIVADLSDWDKTWMTNSPGQSGNPNSPYYKNLFEPWANDQYFPAYYTKAALQPHIDQILVLKPAVTQR